MSGDATAPNVLALFWPLLVGGLLWLGIKLARLVSVKTHNERRQGILLLVQVTVTAAVRETQQVRVDQLKVASARGKLTLGQRSAALQAAIDSAKLQLGKRGLADLQTILALDAAGVDSLLTTWIEAAVYQLKPHPGATWDPGTSGCAVPFVG